MAADGEVEHNPFKGDILRVAAAQIDPTEAQIEENLAKHKQFIDEARERGVEVLVFPELSLTGYQVRSRTPDLAITRHDPRLLALAEYAGDMTVIAGFVEEGYAAQFHNSAAALRAGEVVFIHRKLNLATYGNLEEAKYFARGRYIETFSHRLPWTGSIFICADAWNSLDSCNGGDPETQHPGSPSQLTKANATNNSTD